MDNQQATETDHAYLAGIIDGEGSLGVYGSRRKDGTLNYGARLQIALTNPAGMEHIINILRRMGVNPHLWQKLMAHRNPNWSDAWYTSVHRLHDLNVVLPKVLPYLVIKAPQARMTMEFVTRRLAKGVNKGGNNHINQYDEIERRLIESMRKLNAGVRALTDYTLAPLEGEDIVEPTTKVVG